MSRRKIECAETAKNPRTSGVNAAAVKVRVCGRRQTCRVRHITAQVTTVHIPYAGTQVREYCPSARHLHSAARPGTGIWVREYCHREKTAAKHRTRSADRQTVGRQTVRMGRCGDGKATPGESRRADTVPAQESGQADSRCGNAGAGIWTSVFPDAVPPGTWAAYPAANSPVRLAAHRQDNGKSEKTARSY